MMHNFCYTSIFHLGFVFVLLHFQTNTKKVVFNPTNFHQSKNMRIIYFCKKVYHWAMFLSLLQLLKDICWIKEVVNKQLDVLKVMEYHLQRVMIANIHFFLFFKCYNPTDPIITVSIIGSDLWS
jgi:hypothetical protein